MDIINETERSDSPDDSELRLDLEDLEDAVAPSQSTISSELEMEDTIIWDASGGQVVDNNESSEHQQEVLDVFRLPKIDTNNPLHPWNHEGEIWLTNLLFQNGNISHSTADEFLGAFANGTITMASGPV